MKRYSSAILMVAVLIVSSSSMAHARGFVQSLPKDGAWTTFHMEMTNDGQADQNMTGTFTVRSVGVVTENNEKCRWIELQSEGELNGVKQASIMKFLVREKDLKTGAKTPMRIIRGWQKNQAMGEVRELTDEEKKPNGMVTMFFGGKLKDSKKLAGEKVIDYQKGQIKVASGTKGNLEVKLPGSATNSVGNNVKFEVTQSVWAHKKIPFGLAEMKLVMKMSIGGNQMMEMNMTFTLQDHGTGAKSALPDKN